MSMKKGKGGLFRRIVAFLSILILAVAAAVVIVNWDDLSFDGIKRNLFSSVKNAETFYFDAGEGSVFADLNGGLAIASSSGIQIFNKSGEIIDQETLFISCPSIFAENARAVVYDLGGKSVRLIDKDEISLSLETENPIISCAVNEDGYLALCTQEEGYKGSVTVYDTNGTAIYKWYSGEGYVLSAAISPDNKEMAVLTLADSGSKIVYFDLSSENEKTIYEQNDEIILDLKYLTNSKLLVISESSTQIISSTGSVISQYVFSDKYLHNYAMESNHFSALVLNDYQYGNQGELVIIEKNGEILSSIPIDNEVISISAAGEYLAVLYDDGVTIYDSDLNIDATYEYTESADQVLMRSDKSVLLISSYSANVYNF